MRVSAQVSVTAVERNNAGFTGGEEEIMELEERST